MSWRNHGNRAPTNEDLFPDSNRGRECLNFSALQGPGRGRRKGVGNRGPPSPSRVRKDGRARRWPSDEIMVNRPPTNDDIISDPNRGLSCLNFSGTP